MNPLLALLASLALIALGLRLLGDVKRARATGIGNFIFQWPNNFERSHQPVAFWWSATLYTAVGYLAFVFAAAFVFQAIYGRG